MEGDGFHFDPHFNIISIEYGSGDLPMMDMENIASEITDPQPSQAKAIILWGQDDLLSWAVNLLLLRHRGLTVIRVSNEDGQEALIEAIEKVHPEVVIVYESDAMACPVTRLLEDFPRLRLITINSNNNDTEVYNKQTIRIKEGSDLVSIIEEVAGPEKPGGENQFADKLP